MGDVQTDHRVDLYALGCVAYWLLTAKLVFEGDSAMQVMFHHVQTAPVPPSQRVELPIPAELEALVMQCLEKDPQARPASADEIRNRLEQVPVAQPWTVERAKQWWSTHRPQSPGDRPAAEMLLSHEEREVRIGPRVRPKS